MLSRKIVSAVLIAFAALAVLTESWAPTFSPRVHGHWSS